MSGFLLLPINEATPIVNVSYSELDYTIDATATSAKEAKKLSCCMSRKDVTLNNSTARPQT